MKNLSVIAALALLFVSVVANAASVENAEAELTQQQQEYANWAREFWHSLDRQNGEIALADNIATLTVPAEFYYLNPADAKKVLVEVWGNPPESSGDVLGMLFPADSTPFDAQSWAVTIEYQHDGYVSDADADKINYDELLVDMQGSTREVSAQRVKQGYEPISLVGWAAKPFYDAATHKLHWAKEVKFGQQPVNTLNYNIRILGRKGVLVLNFIASMEQKAAIESQLDSVLALAEFNVGSQYDEFDPDLDHVAAYGIGALVAGNVIAKTGLLAAAILLLKKFGVFIVIGLVAVFARLFKGRKTRTESE